MSYKEIEGLIATKNGLQFDTVGVRFTSDELGETLSLESEKTGIQISVPFGKVEKVIKEERKK